MKEKNIVFIMSSLGFGGAERVVVSYANWLTENTNNNVSIVKFDDLPSAYQLKDTVKVINLKKEDLSKNRFKAIYQRYKFCKDSFKKLNADIILAMFYQTEIYAYFAKPKNCKLIGSERCNILVLNKIEKILTKFSSKKCDGFIFQTNGIKKYFPKKIVKKSVVIPNAISNKLVYDVKCNNKEQIITAMGRLTDQKGFDILIKAFSETVKKHSNYKLKIFGDGQKKDELNSLINDLNLKEKVILCGASSNAINEIANSEIFVLSSRYEGMPNALIEAMATGTACISTDCNFGPSDLIIDDYNGVLVAVDDVQNLSNKINYLIENKEKRKELEKNAIKIREKLDSNYIYNCYYKYFIEVCNKRSLSNKIINVIKNPKEIIRILMERRLLDWLSDKKYLELKYNIVFNKKLNLKNPQTFNEKLQWLKLYDRNPLYTSLVDKYEVRKYIEKTIGKEYLIPLIGVYDNFDEINFDKLPDQFVIKCTHDSGGVVICKDKSKLDIEKAKNKINNSLKRNYFYNGREWPYKNIKPKIIIENYMEDKNTKELIDYKIMCFDGKVKMSFTCSERFDTDGLKVTFFDLDWNKLPFERHYKSSTKKIEKPINYKKMIEFSERLSKKIPFVRVDWYEINGKLYFGELTFYPGCGLEEFTPEEWDYKIGNMIKLPKRKSDKNAK